MKQRLEEQFFKKTIIPPYCLFWQGYFFLNNTEKNEMSIFTKEKNNSNHLPGFVNILNRETIG